MFYSNNLINDPLQSFTFLGDGYGKIVEDSKWFYLFVFNKVYTILEITVKQEEKTSSKSSSTCNN